MRSEITGHLHHNDINDAQHGLRKRNSYEAQLILTEEDLAGETDKCGKTGVILPNLWKAFDKVPHKHLLLKLDFYGVRGKTKR